MLLAVVSSAQSAPSLTTTDLSCCQRRRQQLATLHPTHTYTFTTTIIINSGSRRWWAAGDGAKDFSSMTMLLTNIIMWTSRIVAVVSLSFVTVAGDCGFPGTPSSGFLRPPAGEDVWPTGSTVAYGCEKGYVLFGELQRRCLDNDTWSGEVPTCDKNLALDSKTTQSATFFNYTSSQAVDGHLDTCSFTPRSLDRRWWQVHLPETYTIAAVAISISTGLSHKFTVFVVHMGTSGKLVYEPCGSFDGIFGTK